MLKTCSRCAEEKDLSRFSRVKGQKAKGGGDYYKAKCKDCYNADAKARKVYKRPPLEPAAPGMKRCSRCRQEKPPAEFYVASRRPDGRYPHCKKCCVELSSTPEAKAKQKAYNAVYVVEKKEHRRASYRKHRYGVDDSALKSLLAEQGNACGNQGCMEPITLAEAHVDHDKICCPGRNACGKCIRGLLCPGCNVGVGFFRDDPKKLRGMAEYVERTSAHDRQP